MSEKISKAEVASLSPSMSSGEATHIAGFDQHATWDAKEESKARRKCDFLIMPAIMLLFIFLQFDRTNIANALTDTLRKDVHIGNKEINTAQTLFVVGFIITEIPFNMISKYFGPERFLPITMFCWGIVTWSQMFISSPSGLYACRFLVGALEGGYIPGMVLYISRFYKNEEIGLRYACFWASNSIAGALSGPLSIGLLSLRKRHGLAGWQWLFLIEGVLTCFLAVLGYLYLPHSAAVPKTLFGKSSSMFSVREGTIIVTRVIRDDPDKGLLQSKAVQASDILDTFTDWKLYGHIVAAFLSMVMIYPMNTYAPSIIKSLGFSGLQANGMSSVGSVGALIFAITLAYSSDHLRERGSHISIGYLVGAVGLLLLALAPKGVSKWTLYGGVIITQTGMGSAQGLNAAWLTSRMHERKRPIALAAYVMSIQLAGFPGNQLFRARDAPRYHHGLIIAAACVIAAAVLIWTWKALYWIVDRREVKQEKVEPEMQIV